MHTYDFSPMFRYSVGFDRMQRLLEASSNRAGTNYPPYNIEAKADDTYQISVAVAGFGKEELEVILEKDMLSVVGEKTTLESEATFMHRGIAARNFRLQFNLADHIKICGAFLENGMLMIDLNREIPEELKPQKIEIHANTLGSIAKKAKNLITPEKSAA